MLFARKTVLFVLFLLLLSGVAYGKELWVHGNTGISQDWGTYDCWPMGWGMDMTPESNTYHWIHYALPAKKVRFVKVLLSTYSQDVKISEIDLWNGPSALKFLPVNLFTTNTSFETKQVDFGTTYSFPNGLGISMKVEAGSSGVLSHRIVIGSVGVK